MQQVVCPHCGRQIDARSLSGTPPLACPTCQRRFFLPEGTTLDSDASWSEPVADGELIHGVPAEEIAAAATDAEADEPSGSRMLIYGLAGLAAFLLALIVVVLAARRLRPAIVGPDEPVEKSLSDWIAELREGRDATARRAAAEAIVAQGVPAVLQTLDAACAVTAPGAVPDMSLPAIRALAETGPSSSAAVFGEALGSEKENVRAAAASVLREMGAKANGAVGPLTKALSDKSHWVQWAAAEALGNIGPDAAPAVEALLTLAADDNRFTRRRAVAALGQIGPAAKAAAPALKKAAEKDADPEVRKLADAALYQIDLPGMAAAAMARASQEVRQQIVRLQSPDEAAGVAAANALAKMGPRGRDAVPALAVALHGEHKWLRVAAAEALGAMGREAKNVAPDLRRAAAADDRDIRAAAQAALEQIEGTRPGG